MTQQATTGISARNTKTTKPADTFDLKAAKQRFIARLHELGIQEWELIVAPMRRPRNGIVGYYSNMSQFRSRPRVVVNVALVQEMYISRAVIDEEVRLTIAHEYGHSMAEAIAFVNSRPWQTGHFTVPDWKAEFAGDEEEFAEDFARFCITFDAHHEAFWDRFIPIYAADFKRVFSVGEKNA